MSDFRKDARRFKFLVETNNIHEIYSCIQGLGMILESLRAHSIKEANSLNIARKHLREIKRQSRRLIEENKELNEKLQILEEKKK